MWPVPQERAWGAGGPVGEGLIQGAGTSGPGNWDRGVPSPQGALASSRHHLPPSLVSMGPQALPSRSHLPKWDSVCACVHMCTCVSVCKSAPPLPPEIASNSPKSLTLFEGAGNGEGKSQKGPGLSELPLGKNRSHEPCHPHAFCHSMSSIDTLVPHM